MISCSKYVLQLVVATSIKKFVSVILSVINLKSSTKIPGFSVLVKIISILKSLFAEYLRIKMLA